MTKTNTMSSFKDLRTGKCAINFLPDSPRDFAAIVKLVFLKAALTQMVDYAREKGRTLIDVPQMQEIRDKRSSEKKK